MWQGSSLLFFCLASHGNFVDELRSKPHASVSYSANFRFVLTGSKILDPGLDYRDYDYL